MRLLKAAMLVAAGALVMGWFRTGPSYGRRASMTDEVTRKYFSGRSEVLIDAATAANLPVPAKRIPWLVGAIDGSVIEVTFDAEGNSYVFTTTHPMLDEPMIRILWQDPENGKLYLMWNEAFFLKPEAQRHGLGARSVAIELQEIARHGIRSVGCMAAGPSNDHIGYYAWPLLGFDGELEQRDIDLLPADLAHCRTLNELFLEPHGARHWRRHGRALAVFFDLAPDSASWSILRAYMEDRGITL